MLSDPNLLARFAKRTIIDEDGCWIWQGQIFKRGYGRMKIAIGNGVYKPMQAHRVSYRVFVGEIPEGLFVLHSCHKRACVNPAHLRVGTHADNMQDRDQAGRTKKGAAVYNFVRSEEKAREIAALRATGLSVREICRQAGISWGTYHTMRRDGVIDPAVNEMARKTARKAATFRLYGR